MLKIAHITPISASLIFLLSTSSCQLAQNSPSEKILNKSPSYVEEISNVLPLENDQTTVSTSNSSEPLEATVSESEATPSDLWDRIRAGYQLDLKNLPTSVIKQRQWYIDHPQHLEIVLNRARPFIYYVTERLEHAGLPLELALLPIVESTYDPFAYSASHAAGLWQFIPPTAHQYGLERNRWYDGRRDLVSSTRAAIDFLTYLNRRFKGNWWHALAAYNSGEGSVGKAIRNNKKNGRSTEFWALKLPKETRNYVPQLIALASIIKEPSKFSITLPVMEDKPIFDIIKVSNQISLTTVMDITGTDEWTFSQLNAAYRRSITPPEGTYSLLIPTEKSTSLRDYLASTDHKYWTPYTEYTVKTGDTLSEIALLFETQARIIKKANGLTSDRLKIGQTLLISQDNNDILVGSSQLTRYHTLKHTVRPGDTLSEIAEHYGTSIKNLRRQNSIKGDLVKIGAVLEIQTTAKASSVIGLRKFSYKVRRGDSLYVIAKRFSLSIGDITKWNNLNSKKYLQPGQKLTLFIDRKII
ncbi:MAG: LysM peptidoglycan-binding domain-containing protein [Porticoccaceae bacterium]|nr:LysM peptidoglycan-binding domain-containing protein [Porticoccaceae bacterium]MDG1473613.1 LysM peptidoglycan-binding domain-containing protein [Porticoccaceae bacterium]